MVEASRALSWPPQIYVLGVTRPADASRSRRPSTGESAALASRRRTLAAERGARRRQDGHATAAVDEETAHREDLFISALTRRRLLLRSSSGVAQLSRRHLIMPAGAPLPVVATGAWRRRARMGREAREAPVEGRNLSCACLFGRFASTR